jgi:hypothetical protein
VATMGKRQELYPSPVHFWAGCADVRFARGAVPYRTWRAVKAPSTRNQRPSLDPAEKSHSILTRQKTKVASAKNKTKEPLIHPPRKTAPKGAGIIRK